MHNIKLLREKPDFFKKKFQERNIKLNIDDLLNLDKKNREIINKKEKLEQERKIISKNKDEEKFKKSKQISNEIKKLENDLEVLKDGINKILYFLPNIALDDVPIGSDEKFNKALITAKEKGHKYAEDSKKTFEDNSEKLLKKLDDLKNYIEKKKIKEKVKNKVKSLSSKILNFFN